MADRVKELLDAAGVLNGVGDRDGALRLVDEALRISPGDERARFARAEFDPSSAPTPFAPPPADLFGNVQPKVSNPFAKPRPRTMPPPLNPFQPAAPPPTSSTDPFGARPATPIRPTTTPFGERTPAGGTPRPPSQARPETPRFGQKTPARPATPARPETAQQVVDKTPAPATRPMPTVTGPEGGWAGQPSGTGGRPPTPPPPPREAADPLALIDPPRPPSNWPQKQEQAKLKRARELLEFADHTGALELVEQVLANSPQNAEALALKARSEATLTSMYESKLGDLRRRPKLRLRPDEVIWLNLDHRAGFVLAQIDGTVSVEDLFDLSGMSRLDTARILAQLVEEQVIQL